MVRSFLMLINEYSKKMRRSAARYALYGTSFVLVRLPYRMVRAVTGFLISLGLMTLVRQKKMAQESLEFALGQEKTSQEIQKILKNCFVNLGKGIIELIYFMAHPKMIKEKVSFVGKEHLDAALSQGKGVVLVSAHFGNFPLMLLRLAQEGYATKAIVRRPRDEKIEEHFQKKRTALGLHVIYAHPRKQCVMESFKALRNNELLFIPLDQNFGSGTGVFVEFFGEKAATATGPVLFAMKEGSPIVPIFMVRQSDDTNKIMIEPALMLESKENDQQTIEHNVARITHIIETYIRRYPQEWGWMHRRWKTRPKIEVHDEEDSFGAAGACCAHSRS